ncbi:glycosyltransferase family 15 protein [Exophiala viscosa]|uniref:Glycosyltransferase family 15 protein n=1 Tax=Exophiala viscosa TaxID=2486360 RepID=A0AAN6E2T4_9EURO|nr:glycosyltransferase family 15 protein [Exophiala viscosa]
MNLQEILRPVDSRGTQSRKKHDPVRWLEEHSSPNAHLPNSYTSRPRAAIISLVRTEELDGILQSMRQLEFHWNRNYRYPWIFFSETPFNDNFKEATSNATDAPTYYEVVPREHWATPDWIDKTRYMDSLDYLGTVGVGKGHLLSYHAMIRWNSGFFYNHPALADYQYYWRVEPDVHFFCDIPYDPFAFLAENELVYGFNMDILDDARSFAGLWVVIRDFVAANPDLIHPDADLEWLLDPATGLDYNNCQFFSNFEIGSLDFFRAEPNRKFFEWLDRSGGFYYSRFGDAPVHTLSLALFAPKDAVWFFRDIGYQHDIARHCPPPGQGRMCSCEPTGLDENFYKLVPMESPQLKPRDTCIRLWLGGEWLRKKEGWDQEVERAFGGDGYGGYVLDGKT